MLQRSTYGVLLMLPALWLGGCSDTITASAPPSASTLSRDYDSTLTKTEQQEAIGELRAKTKQKDAAKAAENQAEN